MLCFSFKLNIFNEFWNTKLRSFGSPETPICQLHLFKRQLHLGQVPPSTGTSGVNLSTRSLGRWGFVFEISHPFFCMFRMAFVLHGWRGLSFFDGGHGFVGMSPSSLVLAQVFFPSKKGFPCDGFVGYSYFPLVQRAKVLYPIILSRTWPYVPRPTTGLCTSLLLQKGIAGAGIANHMKVHS